jgi:hypothetical protein
MGVRSIKRVLKIGSTRDNNTLVIASAIRQLRPIEFYYHGGYRTAEPFALGMVLNNQGNNESLLCWQTGGFSDMNESVGWKLYRVADIEGIEVLKDNFFGDRPGYEEKNLEFNKIIACVKLVPRPVEEVKTCVPEPPPPVLVIESSPIPAYVPPPPRPIVKPQPVIRYITHNELMERFRYAHPQTIPELDTTLWREPLATPFPERAESENLPDEPFSNDTRYLVGQTA